MTATDRFGLHPLDYRLLGGFGQRGPPGLLPFPSRPPVRARGQWAARSPAVCRQRLPKVFPLPRGRGPGTTRVLRQLCVRPLSPAGTGGERRQRGAFGCQHSAAARPEPRRPEYRPWGSSRRAPRAPPRVLARHCGPPARAGPGAASGGRGATCHPARLPPAPAPHGPLSPLWERGGGPVVNSGERNGAGRKGESSSRRGGQGWGQDPLGHCQPHPGTFPCLGSPRCRRGPGSSGEETGVFSSFSLRAAGPPGEA